jgi:hypothetical protein
MKKFRGTYLMAVLAGIMLFSGCGDDDSPAPDTSVDVPTTYSFERNGQTTIDFSGQTTRLQMATELINGMNDFDNATAVSLLEMYRNTTASGGDANPFANAELNASTKSVKSKVADSKDFFSSNTADASEIKADFEIWMNAQITEVFPNENIAASIGVAGQLADGSATRYVNAKGLEYYEAVNKSLIGGLMLDQLLNNYLGAAVLDEADNIADNDNGTVVEGQNYTMMEHKWDEAYGYAYGLSVDAANPNATIGADDSFLNKYIGRLEGDRDFEGNAAELFDAFKLGRAAIVAKNYTVRDQQISIIRQNLSELIAIRAVYYLVQAKIGLEETIPAYGTVFHDLSEGYGFIYSLMFTRRPDSNEPFFSKTEVDGFIEDLIGGTNGFWDVTSPTLDNLANAIASRFDFTVDQAGS